METILIICTIFYCIFLNIRIQSQDDELVDLALDLSEMEIKVYNKMMEIRGDIKKSTKQNVNEYLVMKSRRTKKRNKIEKPRGKFTDKRS